MTTVTRFTAEQKAKAALQEVAMRVIVYRGKVERGEMTEADAARKIAIMREIAADYRKLAEAERLL